MKTYNDVSVVQLTGLCGALGLGAELQSYAALQHYLFHPWGDEEIPEAPKYASEIGDDHSPYEYSVAFGPHGTELRVLFEAQARVPGLLANYRAALHLNRRIERRFGTALARFERVRDLFEPDGDARAAFGLWHAVILNPGRPPAFKVYLNPQARGAAASSEVLRQALARLGFGSGAYDFLCAAACRGPERDELKYFSLDLSDEPEARVKVYYCHHDATADDVEQAFAKAPSHRPGDVKAFCRAVAGHEGPFAKKPVSSCFAFVAGSDLPRTVTLHHPIAHYVADDATTMERVSAYLMRQGLDAQAYARAVGVVARRPLRRSLGVQSYASFRREKGGMRFTAYLSPELHRDRTSYSMPPEPVTGEYTVQAAL